ncbi:MAG: hypothetical protein ABI905_11950, partial [Betaproteobacteria bacterium]
MHVAMQPNFQPTPINSRSKVKHWCGHYGKSVWRMALVLEFAWKFLAAELVRATILSGRISGDTTNKKRPQLQAFS